MEIKRSKAFVVLSFLIKTCVILLSSFIASLAFPSKYIEDGIPFLAFFYLIPVFYVIFSSPYKTVWFYGFLYGFSFYYFYNYWLETFHPLAILIAPILESIQYILLFLVLRLSKTLFKRYYPFFALLFYNGYLMLTQTGFLAYPYGNITAALAEYSSLIQIVSVTGIWGLGFIVTMPQVICAYILYEGKSRKRMIILFSSVVLLLLTWLGGYFVKEYYSNKESNREIKIAAIQHSADTWQGGYNTYKENFETLKALTEEVLVYSPDMVVWSETAFVPSVSWHLSYPVNIRTRALVNDFVLFGKSLSVPLITGNPEGVIKDKELAPVLESGDWNWKTYNTVIYFASGEVKGTYRKQHLVPFTEYFPYEKEFPWLYELLLKNDYKWWEMGSESTVFNYDGISFSTPICFEDMFGYISAFFVQNGADIIINLTNDYWSRSVQAEKQHFQLALFRAVENRRPMLRSTNSGITALVLPSGEIVNPLEPFTKTYGIYTIPIGQKEGLTFYTRHPDLFGYSFLSLSLLSILYGISVKIYERVKRKKDREEYLLHLFERMLEE